MAIQHNYKILIIDTNWKDDTFKNCFWEPNRDQTLAGMINKATDVSTGIEGLSRAVMSRKSSPEIITNYTKIIFKDRLELLLGVEGSIEEYKKVRPVYADILQFANKHYDLVFVDVTKGFDKENETKQILEMSNLIVVNITQKLKMMNDYVKMVKQVPTFQKGNILPLIRKV